MPRRRGTAAGISLLLFYPLLPDPSTEGLLAWYPLTPDDGLPDVESIVSRRWGSAPVRQRQETLHST